jgi:hypothetical protein
MKMLWVKEVEIQNKGVTVAEDLYNYTAPDSILLNTNDWGYGQFEIDLKSMNEFKDKLSLIKDSLTRNMIYSTVFMMVREAKLAPQFYLEMVRNHIHLEKS